MNRTSKVEGERRAPPPPPPRGVTLRSTSAVAAASASIVKVTNPSSSSSSSSSSSVPVAGRLHFKSSNGPSDHHVRSLMKENLPTESPSLAVHPGKQQQQQQGYLETRYAYSVNGILGSAAQASAAAAFFAR